MLSQKVLRLLQEATGLEVIEGRDKASDRFIYPAGVEVMYHIVKSSLGISEQESFEKGQISEEPHLYYGRERMPILILYFTGNLLK